MPARLPFQGDILQEGLGGLWSRQKAVCSGHPLQLAAAWSPRTDRVHTCCRDRRPDPFLGLLMAVAPVQAAMPTTCPPSAWTTSRMSLVETHHPHPTRPQSSVFLLNFSSRGYQRTGRGGARGRC